MVLEAKYSKPFTRNGSLYRWMILGDMKYLQFYHRRSEQWLSARDENGIFVVKPLGRRKR